MNINRFQRKLEYGLREHELPIDRNATKDEIDSSIEGLNRVFKDAIEQCVSKCEYKNRILGELPNNIRNFIKERKRLRRILHRTGDPERYNILRADIRNLGIIIKELVINFESDRYKNTLENIRVNSATYGKVKRAAGIAVRESIEVLTDASGEQITNDTAKAELIAHHLQNAHHIEDDTSPDSFSSLINEVVEGVEDKDSG